MIEPPDAEPADVLGHLRAARNEMFHRHAAAQAAAEHYARQADALDAELTALSAMIDRLAENPSAIDAAAHIPVSVRASVGAATATVALVPGKPPDSTREEILALLQSENRIFDISEILEAVRHLGTKDASTRSILAKLSKEDGGPVERVDRGRYRARRRTYDEVAFGEHAVPPPRRSQVASGPVGAYVAEFAEHAMQRRPTLAEFMAMPSEPEDADDEVLFSDHDVRGHHAHGEAQPREESAST